MINIMIPDFRCPACATNTMNILQDMCYTYFINIGACSESDV